MTNPHDHYLESQILTASPQRLRLMLIQGALRQGQLTLEHWDRDAQLEAWEALARCRDIVEELLQSVRADASPLAKQVADLYVFLFQSLCEAQLNRNRQKVADVLRVLETESQTWQQVCEQAADVAPAAVETSARHIDGPHPFPAPPAAFSEALVGERFSIEI
jgi:flagellar protein FliS